jgi:pyridoxine/pyridoxamine 5'-phosphate oxidase
METISQKIAALRREYYSAPFDEDSVDEDPIAQFKKWLDESVRVE